MRPESTSPTSSGRRRRYLEQIHLTMSPKVIVQSKGGPGMEDLIMPRGDKSAYTEKQKRQARHIEEGYLERGVPEEEAEKRAWATVNAMTGGGKKSGSGRGKAVNKAPAKKGGRKGGAASGRRPSSAKSASTKTSARKS
jgi:hypothetical protein